MLRQLLCIATGAGLMLAGPVFAHAKLRSSDPAADAQLNIAPKSLTLTFNENVQLAVLTLVSAGKNIPVPLDRSAPASPKITVALPALAAGAYQVQWSALSADDGHITKGSFTFSIAGAAEAAR